ncbi:hypothetical protein [Sphingomicrobium astaxanthinifaciens]|uniref:hypothetical protein n=1 Tax=Sphingomicrobium astaxanthinifaciens TaxID=1227949 RepID=UPI001FCB01E5|nr:hypothetical protein [Sphingomicrobium astaxanthinifaciens]MCJ7422257.1 hypothetical protein [Sphingomicrobium astaxanthinifaciens]
MRDPFSMVVAIVAIVMGTKLLSSFAKARGQAAGERVEGPEIKALREEVQALKGRLQVLERIAVEKEDSLTRQIEGLRD